MTNNHGDPPLNPEATWTKVTAYAAKNKELQAKSNKEKEESKQNGAQEEEKEANVARTNAPRRNDGALSTRLALQSFLVCKL
jgi:hypothetical protein